MLQAIALVLLADVAPVPAPPPRVPVEARAQAQPRAQFQAQARSYPVPECMCRLRSGRRVPLGTRTCLRVDGRTYLAECRLAGNVSAWREIRPGCLPPVPSS